MPFRTIDTDIWSNAFFDGLKVGQKLLFIYLFSNPLISNIGILETTRARIAYETGTSVKAVNEFLDILEEQGRIVTDGQYILNVKFIAKQTHFGGMSEANKNDRLVKNLLQLFNACPSEKLRRALQQAYPGLFCVRQAPCEDETSPLSNPDKPLVSEQEDPSSCEVSPLSTESKPLGSEKEGSGGDIGDIGDVGEVDHTPLPPQGGTDAAASDACEQREPHTDTDTFAAQAVLAPEQPARKRQTRRDRKDEPPLRPEDWQAWYAMYPRHEARQAGILAWNAAVRSGVLPDLGVLLDALGWQVTANGWTPDRKQYTPLPATYLNARRWQDERPPVQVFSGAQRQAPQRSYSKADEMSYVVEHNRRVAAQVLAEFEAEQNARQEQENGNSDTETGSGTQAFVLAGHGCELRQDF